MANLLLVSLKYPNMEVLGPKYYTYKIFEALTLKIQSASQMRS